MSTYSSFASLHALLCDVVPFYPSENEQTNITLPPPKPAPYIIYFSFITNTPPHHKLSNISPSRPPPYPQHQRITPLYHPSWMDAHHPNLPHPNLTAITPHL